MHKRRTDDVQPQADTAHNHDKSWVLDACIMLGHLSDDEGI